jgi:hypothetical protein
MGRRNNSVTQLSSPQRRALELIDRRVVRRDVRGRVFADGEPKKIHEHTINALLERDMIKWSDSEENRLVRC